MLMLLIIHGIKFDIDQTIRCLINRGNRGRRLLPERHAIQLLMRAVNYWRSGRPARADGRDP